MTIKKQKHDSPGSTIALLETTISSCCEVVKSDPSVNFSGCKSSIPFGPQLRIEVTAGERANPVNGNLGLKIPQNV